MTDTPEAKGKTKRERIAGALHERDPLSADSGWYWDGDGKAIGPALEGDGSGEARDVVWVENGAFKSVGVPPPLDVVRAVLDLHGRANAMVVHNHPPPLPLTRQGIPAYNGFFVDDLDAHCRARHVDGWTAPERADRGAALDDLKDELAVRTQRVGRRIMDPHEPGTHARENGILLVLDNGVRIESGGNPKPGAYVLVADRDGYEIGYWNAHEWGENPQQVMTQLLLTAANGVALDGEPRPCGYVRFPKGVLPEAQRNPSCVRPKDHDGECRFE